MTIEKLIEVLTRLNSPKANVFLGTFDEGVQDRSDFPIEGFRVRLDGDGAPVYVVLEDE